MTSMFDQWLDSDGQFSPDRFNRSQVAKALDPLANLPNIDKAPAQFASNRDYIAYLASLSVAYGQVGKRFVNGKRQIVFFAICYVKRLKDRKERNALLKEMPTLFGYLLGEKTSKAWSDILTWCNSYPAIALGVGKGDLPQATLNKVSRAITWTCAHYATPGEKRKSVARFFDQYYRKHANFGDDTVNATNLLKLWKSEHPEEITDTHTKRFNAYVKEESAKRKARQVFSGTKSYTEVDDMAKARVKADVKELGVFDHLSPDLDRLSKALRIEHDREDAQGVLENALDYIGKVTIELQVKLENARKAKADKLDVSLPKCKVSMTDFKKALKVGLPIEDFNLATITLLPKSDKKKRFATIVYRNGKEESDTTMVTDALFYRFRSKVDMRPHDVFEVSLTG